MQLLSTMYFNLSGLQSRIGKKKESDDLGNVFIEQICGGLRAVFPLHLGGSSCKQQLPAAGIHRSKRVGSSGEPRARDGKRIQLRASCVQQPGPSKGAGTELFLWVEHASPEHRERVNHRQISPHISCQSLNPQHQQECLHRTIHRGQPSQLISWPPRSELSQHKHNCR